MNDLKFIEFESAKNWKAYKKWDFEYFKEKYGDIKVNVSNTDFSENYIVTLSDYIEYILESSSTDKDLLYLRDWNYKEEASELELDFIDPTSQTNIFKGMDNQYYRDIAWIYIGPKNSCTPLHQDYLHTHTWNALIRGKKEWTLYNDLNNKKDEIIIIQNEGDIVNLPADCWHSVKNLEPSISITKNYVDEKNVVDVVNAILKEVNLYEKERD